MELKKVVELINEEKYLTEESFIMTLRKDQKGIVANISINGRKNNTIYFDKLPIEIRKKMLKALQDIYSKEENVEDYVKKQKNPVIFSIIGNHIRLINDGKKDFEEFGKYKEVEKLLNSI